MTPMDVIAPVMAFTTTCGVLVGGVLYVHPSGAAFRKTIKDWRTTGIRAKKVALIQARAHKKRMAVYDAAAEARRKAIQTKMLNRQDARERWETEWVEAGAHRAMLDPLFGPIPEGAPKQIEVSGGITVVSGSRLGEWNEEEGHRYLVGNQGERHLGYYCDICKPQVEKNMAEAEERKKAVAEAKAFAAKQVGGTITGPQKIKGDRIQVRTMYGEEIWMSGSPDGRALNEALAKPYKSDPHLVDSMMMATLRDELIAWVRQFKNKAPGPVETKAAAALISLLRTRDEPAPIWVEVIAAGRNPRAVYKMLDRQADTDTGLTKAEEKLYRDLENEMWDFND